MSDNYLSYAEAVELARIKTFKEVLEIFDERLDLDEIELYDLRDAIRTRMELAYGVMLEEDFNELIKKFPGPTES